ncbi:hypothetical protein BH23CHL2_BH23CHL2_05650 [soil metagenome]
MVSPSIFEGNNQSPTRHPDPFGWGTHGVGPGQAPALRSGGIRLSNERRKKARGDDLVNAALRSLDIEQSFMPLLDPGSRLVGIPRFEDSTRDDNLGALEYPGGLVGTIKIP